jgi:hypothetical protein
MPFVLFVSWISLAIFVGIYAKRTHRSNGMWIVLALIFSPLMTWLLLLALGPAEPSTTTHQQCGACMEWMPAAATKCKHCGSVMPSAPIEPSSMAVPLNQAAQGTSLDEFQG